MIECQTCQPREEEKEGLTCAKSVVSCKNCTLKEVCNIKRAYESVKNAFSVLYKTKLEDLEEEGKNALLPSMSPKNEKDKQENVEV